MQCCIRHQQSQGCQSQCQFKPVKPKASGNKAAASTASKKKARPKKSGAGEFVLFGSHDVTVILRGLRGGDGGGTLGGHGIVRMRKKSSFPMEELDLYQELTNVNTLVLAQSTMIPASNNYGSGVFILCCEFIWSANNYSWR
mmetsp:Transcript_27688/g.45416  ORF Transcript_27688/g.45416 Transcript_27688/m.45416 type:complete len:142 (-) Transcript_27688:213-638(-)